MDGKTNKNREFYKAAFSRLHASGTLKACEMMEDNIMEGKKYRKIRISRPIAVFAAMAVLVCVMSVGTFAATGGETANPVTGVKLIFNGKDVTYEGNVNSDGSVDVEMKAGDVMKYSKGDEGSEVSVETLEAGGKLHIDKDMNVQFDIYDVDGGSDDGEPTLKGSYQASVTEKSGEAGGTDAEDEGGSGEPASAN